MARTSETIDTSPERVWEVLADPSSYGTWVVGSKHIRRADPDWPAPGSRFHHTVGIGPIHIKDSTEVLEADPGRHLKLRARARPTGIAHVELTLRAVNGTTEVEMTEFPVQGFAKLVHNPLQDKLIHVRNVESLRRLKALAERPGGAA